MKLFAFALFLSTLSLSAFAGERVIQIDLFKNHDVFPVESRNLKIHDLRLVVEPKKILIVEDENCGDYTSSCMYRTILEKEQVVQLTLSFEKVKWIEDEDQITLMTFNFPLSSFSSFDLQELTALSKNRTANRKREEARRKMAVRLFHLYVSVEPITISVVDYERSTFCHEDDRYCRDQVIMKDEEILANKITVTIK